MLDAYLSEALGRLDRRLVEACDEEERRSQLLGGDGAAGWEAVRNLARPPAELLAPETAADPDLLPAGDHLLRRLGTALRLAECELEAVLVLLSGHVEPRYQAVYAVLQDDLRQPRPTERLVLTVLGRAPERRATLLAGLGPAGTLVRAGVVVRGPGGAAPFARTVELAEDVVAALLGAPHPPVPGAAAQRWDRGRGPLPADAPVRVVHGTGDRAAAARELTAGDLLEVAVGPAAPDAARAAWRVGICTGALPVLDLSILDRGAAEDAARTVEQLTRDLGGRAWLLTPDPLPLAVPHTEARPPDWARRRDDWLAEAARAGLDLDPAEAGRLAARHRLAADGIRRTVEAAGTADALDRTAADLGVGQVPHSVRRTPRRSFADLVLRDTTADALDRLVHYVRNRDRVAAEFGLERRYQLQRGPIALFAGRSGTGKTLAAEAVALELGRPLHVVDLAQLVSKWVGETEKHIDEVMAQAERASAVLFFDEADALFGTRTESASGGAEQFANMLIGYLLQRVEQHDGLTILATNLRHGLDDAFQRRFQFRVEFPLPEADERRRIWELMLPDTVPRTADVDLDRVAKAHRLSGGDIRNAALKAVFLADRRAGPVTAVDLDRAVALELLELGRLSRRESTADPAADRGRLLRGCLDDLHEQLSACVRRQFLKEIHVVHGSPTEDALAGKRPAVSVALFRLAARRGADGLRAGFVVSAWSYEAEEESELLGVVHEALSAMTLSPVLGRQTRLRVQESHDFDLLHRFWSSHGHPVRPSVVIDVETD